MSKEFRIHNIILNVPVHQLRLLKSHLKYKSNSRILHRNSIKKRRFLDLTGKFSENYENLKFCFRVKSDKRNLLTSLYIKFLKLPTHNIFRY